MANVKTVELIPDQLSGDTIECLTTLLRRAEAGEITGIAYAVVLRRRRYIVNTCGTARKYPTFTRGMVHALDDELSSMIRHGSHP